jgi:cytochrome b
MNTSKQIEIVQYPVWDLPVRLFHWINVLSIFGLLIFGFIMLYSKELGIIEVDARIALKAVHVVIGYVFVSNLLIRLIWAFVGNRYARWSAFLPRPSLVAGYLTSLRGGQPQVWAGHNPLGRLAVSFLFLLLVIMAATGLVRAGTDIYYPPFGSIVERYIAADPDLVGQLKPYDESQVDPEKFAELKAFKKPFGLVHLYTAYVLLALLVVHIAAVIVTERREGGALISAMFTGKKYLRGTPEDAGGPGV